MVEAAGEDYDSSDIGDGIKIGPDLHNGVTDSSSLSWGGLNLQYLRPTRLYTRLKHSSPGTPSHKHISYRHKKHLSF